MSARPQSLAPRARRFSSLARWGAAVLTLFTVLSATRARAGGDSPPPGASHTAPDAASSSESSHLLRNFTFYLDEDNLQQFSRHTDRNYTLGTGFVWGGRESHHFQDGALTLLDGSIGRIGCLFGRGHPPRAHEGDEPTYFSRRLEGGAFTPESIGVDRIQLGDRPWAFLLGWTVTRVDARTDSLSGRTHLWLAEATIGTIGSPIGEVVQRSIHAAARTLSASRTPLDPRGWANQIMNSRFGVPTARFKLEYTDLPLHVRYAPRESALFKTLDTKPMWLEGGWRGGFEVGYYTDISAGVQLRAGWIHSNSWERTPDLSRTVDRGGGDPAWKRFADLPPGQRFWGHLEIYAFGSADGYLYGYNALLQGYGNFWSKYRLDYDQIEKATVNAQCGLAVGWQSIDRDNHAHAQQFRYVPEAFHSKEFHGARARGHHWGGVQFVLSEKLPG